MEKSVISYLHTKIVWRGSHACSFLRELELEHRQLRDDSGVEHGVLCGFGYHRKSVNECWASSSSAGHIRAHPPRLPKVKDTLSFCAFTLKGIS